MSLLIYKLYNSYPFQCPWFQLIIIQYLLRRCTHCLIKHHAIKTYCGSGGIAPRILLTSPLDGGEW